MKDTILLVTVVCVSTDSGGLSGESTTCVRYRYGTVAIRDRYTGSYVRDEGGTHTRLR